MTRAGRQNTSALELDVDGYELVIRQRYETLSIINDVLVGVWFTVGSVLFFWDTTTTAAIWLFVIGSVELLVRPVIRLVRRLHLRRLPSTDPPESDDDF